MDFVCGIITCEEPADHYGNDIYLCAAHAFEAEYLEEDESVNPNKEERDYYVYEEDDYLNFEIDQDSYDYGNVV